VTEQKKPMCPLQARAHQRDKLKCHTLVCCYCLILVRRTFLKLVAKKNARRKRYLKRMRSRFWRANVKKVRRLEEARALGKAPP